jgi:hypothetical protein
VLFCADEKIMDITLPLDQMTTAEKLRAMEALWADLSRNPDNVPSPAWHEQILKEREDRVKSGQEKFVDWETAKQDLRDRLK